MRLTTYAREISLWLDGQDWRAVAWPKLLKGTSAREAVAVYSTPWHSKTRFVWHFPLLPRVH